MSENKQANSVPVELKIDNSLSKYNSLPLFQEKLDKANETIRRVGIPKFPIK